MSIQERKTRIILSALIFLLWAITIIYINIKLAPIGKTFQLIIFFSVFFSFCLYRVVNRHLLTEMGLWFMYGSFIMLVPSGIEYAFLDNQRPYTLILWAISWESFEVIQAFRHRGSHE